MPKLICIFLFIIGFSSVANSSTIENFDAFQKSDNLALRDVDTGLVWLDFGINNGESINFVVNNLSGLYSGWRLPTEVEVITLWNKLACSDLTEIFDFWGANKTPKDNFPYLSWGYFIDAEGYLGAAYIKEVSESSSPLSVSNFSESRKIVLGVDKKIIDVKYDGSDYYLFDLYGVSEISTLLVKRTEVDEPSILLLLTLFFSILIRKNITI